MTNRTGRRRRGLVLGGAAALVALGAACDGPGRPSGDTSAVSADLLAGAPATRAERRAVPVGGVQEGELSRATPPASTSPSQEPIDLATLGYNSGPEDALVRVIEFSDFGCSYCRKFHLEDFHALESEYMETGKVEWKYVPIVLGRFRNAQEAATAGECAGEQGLFPAMRDRLFEAQSDWKGADDPWPLLRGYARELGVDEARWQQCVDEGWREQRIALGSELSRQVGLRGTPTFFVVGYAPIPGMIPLDMFREVLDTVYAEKTRDGG